MASTESDLRALDAAVTPPARDVRLLKADWLVTAVFIAALLLLAVIAVITLKSLRFTADRAQWVEHTYRVMLLARRLETDELDMAAGDRGYAFTRKPQFEQEFQESRAKLAPDLDQLAAITADNPVQQQRIVKLRELNALRVQEADRLMASAREGGGQTDAGSARLATLERALQDIYPLIDAVTEEEQRLLSQRLAQAERSRRQTLFIIVAGDLLGFLALATCLWLLTRQIRERRQAETSLAERARQLELANSELEGFSYSISHDLRSPLRAIDGFSQLLQKRYQGTLDEEGMRLLGVVRDNSRRMGALIEDLLAFSRLGRKPLECDRTDMQSLVRECLDELLPDAHPKPEMTVGTLPACWGDRALLKQVWLNLIGNAVKYSSHSPAPRIQIDAALDGDHCVYTVRDNGVGFDMAYSDKLFGVFERLHSAKEFEGTGIGLANVKRIVSRHGGRVWADGKIDQGATFYFALPARQPAE